MKYLPAAIISSMFVLPVSAMAQDTQNATLEEITVTAQRRAEGLGDVPLSISATSGKTIEKFGITRFDDLQQVIPNLDITEGVANPTITIRGLGSGAANFGFEQAVGMFIDGVYIGRSRLLSSPMFDVERVEVVRGPQGALFGKNTVAGAVSITTAKPTEEFEAKLKAGYEAEYGGSLFEGVISGALSENLNGRLAGKYAVSGGYMDNVVTGADDGERDTWLLRGSLAFGAGDSFNGVLKLEASEVNVDGSLFQTHVPGPLAPLSAPNEFALDDVRASADTNEFEDTESSSATLTMNWDVGEHTVTSITSYSDLSFGKFLNLTGTVPTYATNDISEDFDQFYQEIRVLSPAGETFDYSFGVSYMENDLTTRQIFGVQPRILGGLGIMGVAPFLGETDRNFEQDLESWSAYVSGTWNVSDLLRVTAGVRYSDETKKGRAFHVATPQDGVGPPEVPPTWIDYDVSDVRDEDKFTPSLNVQYDLTENNMVYFSYSEGHKGGGFVSNESTMGTQLANAAPGENPFQYEDEEAESFEIGIKSKLLDGRATLNVALFQTDFDNLQVSNFNGSGFDTRNAAGVRSKGVEFDARVLLSQYTTLGLAGAYLDSEYTDYPNAFACSPAYASDVDCQAGGDGQVDLTGRTLIKAPEYEGSMFLDFSVPMGQEYLLGANLLVTHKAEMFLQPDLDVFDAQDAVTQLSARLSVSDVDNVWDVALIGRNLTNEKVLAWSFDTPFTPGAHSSALAPLRTVAIEGSYRF